jgi:hypothetical protein
MNERYVKVWNASAGWLVSRVRGPERFDLFSFLFHLDAVSQRTQGYQEQLKLACSFPAVRRFKLLRNDGKAHGP